MSANKTPLVSVAFLLSSVRPRTIFNVSALPQKHDPWLLSHQRSHMQLSDQPILLIHPSRVNIIIAFTSGQEGVTGKVARFAYWRGRTCPLSTRRRGTKEATNH